MPREENHPRLPHLSLIPDIDFLSRARIVIAPARHMSLMLQGSLRTSCNRKHALSEPCCPSFAVSRIQLCRTRLRGVSMATRACTSPQGAAYWRRGGVWWVWIGGNHLTKAVKLIWICPFEHWLHQIKIKYCHHIWCLEMHRVEMTQFIQEHLAFHKSRVRGSQKKNSCTEPRSTKRQLFTGCRWNCEFQMKKDYLPSDESQPKQQQVWRFQDKSLILVPHFIILLGKKCKNNRAKVLVLSNTYYISNITSLLIDDWQKFGL